MMVIDATKAIESIDEIVCSMSVCINSDYYHGMRAMKDMALHAIEKQPAVDTVEVVRCKECKHRPKYDGPNRLVFPDCICPCQCDDCYYNWMPSDDWFCPDGERENDADY